MGTETDDNSNVQAAVLLARAARGLSFGFFLALLYAAWRVFAGVVDWRAGDGPFPWLWFGLLVLCPVIGLWLQGLGDRTIAVAEEAHRAYYRRRQES